MSENLVIHIRRLLKRDDLPYSEIVSYFQPFNVAKKENLHVEGKVCDSNYFIDKGCLRMYFINEKGVEQTTEFAIENWWLADYNSFFTHLPSEFNIQAVENTTLLALDSQALERLLDRFPVMEKYFRLVHQRAHAAAQYRIKILYSLSGEELYHQFNSSFPEFVQRVPQYLLASFLGITPEYLSEIRRRRIS